jgi:Protein kinase domain
MDERVRRLFYELAGRPAAEREQVFCDRCIAPEIRAEVESLLEFDSPTSLALTDCVAGVAGEALQFADLSRSGEFGPYRLIRKLGSGGMGVVYLAERFDGELQLRVAIKVLASGDFRPAWRERFLKERQILASLNHPSIVHAIDAGHTPDGRPYLVMEWVEGVTIDAYCVSLGLQDVLRMFLRVCDGVSHAHRHLIVHRDLKPSNIVVDASGAPKLLDFGIARLLDETSDRTQTVERLLTPDYASPEQLRGMPETTATDVYSLGAVLYRLLTNRSPHKSLTDYSKAFAAQWNVPPLRRPNSALPGDIDWILSKALRLEPDARYPSVDAFAADIGAFLRAEAVQARAADRWYRARKFVRRHILAGAAAALIIISLTTGLYIAEHERAIAQRRFDDVRQLADKLFDIDLQARQLPGNSKMRELIVNTCLEYLRRVAADARRDPALALDVANAYMRVARVQGVPVSSNLGQMEEAEKNLRNAEAYLRPVLVRQPSNAAAILRSAQIAHDRMLLARFNGRNDQALPFARESGRWLAKIPVRTMNRQDVEAVLITYVNVAQQHTMGDQFDEALRLSKVGSDIARSIQSNSYLGMFSWISARIYQRRGDLTQALSEIEDAVSLLEPAPGATESGRSANFVLVLTAKGKILNDSDGVSLGRVDDAISPLRQAFQVSDDAAHQDQKDQSMRGRVAEAGLALAECLRNSDPRAALAVYDHVLRHLGEIRDNRSFQRYEVVALARSTYPLQSLHLQAEARRRLDKAFALLKLLNLYPADTIEPGSEPYKTLRAVADYKAQTGDLRGAVENCDQLLNKVEKSNPDPATNLADAVDLSNLYRQLAILRRRNGETAAAAALDARRLAVWKQWANRIPGNDFVSRQLASAR